MKDVRGSTKMRLLLSVVIVMFFGFSNSQQSIAAIITGYNVFGSPTGGREVTVAPSIVAPNITGSLLARGPGLRVRGGTTANANSFTSIGFNGESTDYITFGFTVAPGYTVALENLLIGIGGSGGAPNQFSLFYSGDNFATALGSVDIPPTPPENVQANINLTSLTNLQGAVEFRIFATSTIPIDLDPAGTLETSRVIIGNYFTAPNVDSGSFGFNGTVTAVPEPSSLALLACVTCVRYVRHCGGTKTYCSKSYQVMFLEQSSH
jgi:hypothetical protein